MTKQEEIREGIRTSILENTLVNIQRGVVWKINGLSNFLSYLHSQGVVIKVEREYSPTILCPSCESLITSDVPKKVGLVAVESLM